MFPKVSHCVVFGQVCLHRIGVRTPEEKEFGFLFLHDEANDRCILIPETMYSFHSSVHPSRTKKRQKGYLL